MVQAVPRHVEVAEATHDIYRIGNALELTCLFKYPQGAMGKVIGLTQGLKQVPELEDNLR